VPKLAADTAGLTAIFSRPSGLSHWFLFCHGTAWKEKRRVVVDVHLYDGIKLRRAPIPLRHLFCRCYRIVCDALSSTVARGSAALAPTSVHSLSTTTSCFATDSRRWMTNVRGWLTRIARCRPSWSRLSWSSLRAGVAGKTGRIN
jgi:hypothetical protein